MKTPALGLLLFVSHGFLASVANAVVCRPLSDTYPATLNSTNDVIRTAGESVNTSLATLLANDTVVTGLNETSFSVEAFSIHDPESLFTFHYSALSLANSTEGVAVANSTSIYRIGSISKAWTVYIWLLAVGDEAFNDPITRYVPELAEYASSHDTADQLNILNWNSVTIGALASQLSGFSRDPWLGSQVDVPNQRFFNLPPPVHEASNSSFCGDPSSAGLFYCSRQDMFSNNLFRSPNVAVFSTPAYANLPYQILSYALENITNTSFPDLFQTYIIDQHNLESTFYTIPPTPNNSVIPINASISLYNVDFNEGAAYGGYFSSLTDVSKIARAVLNSTYLDPAMTRRWLKPVSFAPPGPLFSNGGIVQAVGAPWEIIRAPAPASSLTSAFNQESSSQSNDSITAAASQYQTWIYTKEGDVGLYSSLTAIIPEFDAGFTILTAGPAAHLTTLYLADIITETYIPAFFEAARIETAASYTGSFTDGNTNSSAKIEVPGPESVDQGMILSELIYNGSDFISLFSLGVYGLPQGIKLVIRLYPDRLSTITGSGTQGQTEAIEGWRASFSAPDNSTPMGAFTSACWAWSAIGGLNYGGVSFDDFRFRVSTSAGGAKVVTGFDVPALQLNLTKTG